MGPLEQARVPDQEPMEPHGTTRGSRSKDNGPLELWALSQESMRLLRIPLSVQVTSGSPWWPGSEAREFRKPNGAHETIPKPPLANNEDILATARKHDLGVVRLR